MASGAPRRSRAVWIDGPRGRLAAVEDEPLEARAADGPVRPWAVICHGFGSTKEFKPLARLAHALVASGFSALRFDFAGQGRSEGDFTETRLATLQADLRAVVRHVTQQGREVRLLAGHSLGGATVLSLAQQFAPARAATIAAPADTAHLARQLRQMQPALRDGPARVVIAGRSREITPEMLAALEASDIDEPLRTLRQPLLLVHGDADQMVPPAHARRIAELTGQPEALRMVAGADHLLSRDEDSRQAAAWIAEWATAK